MGAFLSCLFLRSSVKSFDDSASGVDGFCGQEQSLEEVNVQLFDCAFISGICQDHVDQRMIAFTREPYPLEVIFCYRQP